VFFGESHLAGCCSTCVFTSFTSPRIFQVPKLGVKLKQDSIPLSYTPRKFITHPTNNYFYMIEGDHRVLSEAATEKKLRELVCTYSCPRAIIGLTGLS